MQFLKLYLLSLPLFAAFDLFWIGVVAQDFYQNQIGHLMSPQVRWGAAVLFYLIYLFGLIFFVVDPAIKKGGWAEALFHGALFGIVCYATYDLTNLATLTNWPIKMVCYDLLWGGFASGIVSLITYLMGKMFIKP